MLSQNYLLLVFTFLLLFILLFYLFVIFFLAATVIELRDFFSAILLMVA